MGYVRRLPAKAAELAAVGFAETEALTAEEKAIRDFTIETARLVFTALLREENGKAIHLHILGPKDVKGAEAWRLCNSNINMDAT
jgi:hypothetical protein